MKQLLITIAALVLVGCGQSVPDISIHEAAATGNIQAVKQHLANGADVNAIYSGGWSVLDMALTSKNEEVITLVKTSGGRSNADKSIFAASGIGNIEAVKQHLASGVDVNTKDSQSGTPLHYASDQIKVAEFLLEKDARVNSVDYRGRTPLDYAMSARDSETADLLRQHGGKTGKELKDLERVKESIQAAARIGHIEAVKQHLAAGANVNAKTKSGWTPLHLAASEGHREIVELLIEKGADVNAKDLRDETPLDKAIGFQNTNITDLLRKHGGRSSAELSIVVAAELGNTEAVKQHLAAGTDVNAMDKDGETALDFAVKYKRTEIANLLRKHGGKTGAELKAEGK